MSNGTYAAGKVAAMARQLLVALGSMDAKAQDKVLAAMSKIPLCEMYLSDIGSSIPRPSWITNNNYDLGPVARGESTFEQEQLVRAMAPQHKAQLLRELLDWWITALSDAAGYLSTECRRVNA